MMVMMTLQKPVGWGSLKIVSSDPWKRPVVDTRLNAHPDDLALTLQGFELCRQLSLTEPLAGLGRCVFPTQAVARSKHLLKRWIPRFTDSGYHPSGTCAMGTITDSRGRIDGLAGVRICDASLMPTIPSSNIHLPTLMIGERFGEWLREDLT
jgi:choline dehydrogenase